MPGTQQDEEEVFPKAGWYWLHRNDHTLRERIHVAARKKKKQVADEATKSMSSKGKASKATNKATTDDEGRPLIKCLDRALHDCVGDMGDMEDAKTTDCTAHVPSH